MKTKKNNKSRNAEAKCLRVTMPIGMFNRKQMQLLEMASEESGKSEGVVFGEVLLSAAKRFFSSKRCDNPNARKAVKK